MQPPVREAAVLDEFEQGPADRAGRSDDGDPGGGGVVYLWHGLLESA